MARLTEAKLLDLISRLHGNVAAIARSFDVTRSSVYDYIASRPKLQTALQDARETMIDNVESRFYSDCLKEDPAYQTSRIFFLKTQAKSRGYVERTEMTGADGKPVRIRIIEEVVDADGHAGNGAD